MSQSPDPEQRGQKLKSALRRNRASRVIPELIDQLRRIGLDVQASDFLSIEDTDALQRAYLARYRQVHQLQRDLFGLHDWPEVFRLMHRLADKVEALSVVLFTSKSDLWFGIRVSAGFALRRVPAALNLEEDDFILVSSDIEHGLALELIGSDSGTGTVLERLFEVRRWGAFDQ